MKRKKIKKERDYAPLYMVLSIILIICMNVLCILRFCISCHQYINRDEQESYHVVYKENY